MRTPTLLAVATLLGGSLLLTACSAPAAPQAHVVVKVAPSAQPEAYEVHLAQQRAGYRTTFSLRPGESRTVAVPVGWVTVRVAGLCVVPAPTTGTTTVVVRSDDCRIV